MTSDGVDVPGPLYCASCGVLADGCHAPGCWFEDWVAVDSDRPGKHLVADRSTLPPAQEREYIGCPGCGVGVFTQHVPGCIVATEALGRVWYGPEGKYSMAPAEERIRTAVLAERARCAKIAREIEAPLALFAAGAIAAKIEAGE